jgi:hypothetical protein
MASTWGATFLEPIFGKVLFACAVAGDKCRRECSAARLRHASRSRGLTYERLVAEGEKVRGRAERHRKRHWRGPELPNDPRQLQLPFKGRDGQ